MNLSAIIIAKNAEDTIADCIDSVSFCDEVIVVDNKSEDRTSEIAERMRAKVFDVDSKDFSKLRNFGLSKASGEWILYVDTDERVSSELRAEIEHLTKDSGRDNKLNAYILKRKNFYYGNHQWPYIEKLERLFKRESLERWYGQLHESPHFKGNIGQLDGYLFHYTHRDLSSMLKKTIEWSKIEAELRYKAGHPKMKLWRFPRVMLTAFFDSFIRQGGWRVGSVGLLESMYQAFSIFITYARLWELQREKKS